ncbi:glycosyltransferase [Luminiphilus sp.]|nr:glycosyltransferase [Luminiphilus sp.]MDB2313487.1 glycosyltransferase [Luminiphilus sp.]
MIIALNNPHLNALFSYHGYVRYLLAHKEVKVLFFSDHRALSFIKGLQNYLRQNSLLRFLNLDDYDIVFSAKSLSSRADVLLDINLLRGSLEHELPMSLRHFDGLKVAHIGDYFWYHPTSAKNQRLEAVGVDHLFGYSMHDRYCGFFHKKFPKYRGKTWGIPFGFESRFVKKKPFRDRINKVVALGSVRALRPPLVNPNNYMESSKYFSDDDWFHRFRRRLGENKDQLGSVMDSMLPDSHNNLNAKYDLPAKFNDYKMFTSCESIYNFPSAKVYEGMASGSVLVCADHDCNKDIGLIDTENCIMFKYENLAEFALKVEHFQRKPEELEGIAREGERFVQLNYDHNKIASLVIDTITRIVKDPSADASPVREILQTHN